MLNPDSEPLCGSEVAAGHCEPGSKADILCRNQVHKDDHKTQCFNKDANSKNTTSDTSNSGCDCSSGYKAEKGPAKKGTEVGACVDVNECAETPNICASKSKSDKRHACLNVPGLYSCLDNVLDECDPKSNYGGCWNEAQAAGASLNACKDNLEEYQLKAAQYTGAEGDWKAKAAPPLHTCDCAVVEGCYTGSGDTCTKKCDDAHCNSSTSQCVKSDAAGAHSTLCCCS